MVAVCNFACTLQRKEVQRYHASPQSTLVTDAFLTGPAENTQLLVVVLTSENGIIKLPGLPHEHIHLYTNVFKHRRQRMTVMHMVERERGGREMSTCGKRSRTKN